MWICDSPALCSFQGSNSKKAVVAALTFPLFIVVAHMLRVFCSRTLVPFSLSLALSPSLYLSLSCIGLFIGHLKVMMTFKCCRQLVWFPFLFLRHNHFSFNLIYADTSHFPPQHIVIFNILSHCCALKNMFQFFAFLLRPLSILYVMWLFVRSCVSSLKFLSFISNQMSMTKLYCEGMCVCVFWI